jgi:biopolymer transport protein ExbB
MRTRLLSLTVSLAAILGAPGLAAAWQGSDPTVRREAIGRLSSSAADQLAQSTRELDALRDQIAAEKLPLAQELTALEEKLANLRKEHERVTRLADSGNLEIPQIKADMKFRQDELAYVGNLLDEYARTFDSKVHPSELQVLGEAILEAKTAGEDATMPRDEKSAHQLELVDLTVKRLLDAVGGMRFSGVGVDLQGSVIAGQFALIGPVALFHAVGGAAGGGGQGEAVAGVVVPQSGSTNPLIRPLEGPLQAGLASLVSTGEGLLPLDPSRGGALKALIQKTNIVDIFEKGGPIMWPLLFASVLALATVLERTIFLMIERMRRDPKALNDFFVAVGKGAVDDAVRIGKASKYFVVRALGYALEHKEQSLQSAVLYAQEKELNRYRRGIPILDTVITLAPLLGLLGTVTGMMGSFSIIGGDLSSPGAITGGIAEALIATAFGLGIAILCLLPFNFLNTKMDVARHEIESAATQLEIMTHSPGIIAVPAANGAPPVPVVGPRDRPSSTAEVHERLAREDALRKRAELKLKREALRRQMAEVELQLDERDVVLQPRSVED